MMANSKIEWTEKVWNPITGCSPVSEGCAHCYAKRMANRLRGRYGYPADDPFRVTFHPDKLFEPLHWKKPRRVFVCSMGDLFHEDVSKWDIYKILLMIEQNPRHTFLILTKHIKRMSEIIIRWAHQPPDEGLSTNIWLGVSVENQHTADERIPILLQIPAAVRFVSVEPMLERIEFEDIWLPYIKSKYKGAWHYNGRLQKRLYKKSVGVIDWVICGGESGPGRRPFKLEWARDLRDQCKVAGVPFFMKQIDKKSPIPDDLMIREWPR